MVVQHLTLPQPMPPPAGRPRTGAHRDLPPRMQRKVRGKSVCYYYQRPDKSQIPLGGDFDSALKRWAEIHSAPASRSPDAFCAIADIFEKQGISHLAPKTRRDYSAALTRLSAVFKDAPLASIKPGHVGQLLHSLSATPVMANRLKATLSTMWNWARSRGMTDLPNPCQGVRGHRESVRLVIVTPAMFWAVYDRADQVLKDWMRLDIVIGQRVTSITKIERGDVVVDGKGRRALRYRSGKTKAVGLMAVEGDLSSLIDELMSRQRNATGRYLLQTDNGQTVTYSMLRNRFDEARERASIDLGDGFTDWQMRDIRKTSLNQASTLEEARRRALHTDPRTTARHYEILIDSEPGAIPARSELRTLTDELRTSENKNIITR